MTELYLVRHGETDWNRARRIQGRTDVPLNDTGREQARAVAEILTRRRWDAVLTSPLSRARETAEIIADALGLDAPEVFEGAMERDYGAAEGMDFAELQANYPGDQRAPGAETRDEVAARAVPALLALAEERPGQSLLVVSHGGTIRSVLVAVDPEQARETITNASVHSFRVEAGALQLIAFNDPIEEETRREPESEFDFQNPLEAQEDGVA